MELPGSPEWMQKPELDANHPAKLFIYAKDKQRWLRRTQPSEDRLIEGIDYLVDELERYVTHNFDSMPEIDIVSSDVYSTRDVFGEGGRHMIESGPHPLKGDAELLGEHAIRATLYGFHRGQNQDLRVYTSSEEQAHHLMGGIYVPLLSVGVDKSEIKITEYQTEEQLEEVTTFIYERIDEYDTEVAVLVREFVNKLNDSKAPAVLRLNAVSPLIAKIAQHADSSPQFIDALLDAVFLKLDLNIPHDIQVSSHRVVLSDQIIAAYKAVHGPTVFREVVPQLGLIGETGNKGLGMFFMNNESAVQIPVQFITRMNIS